MELNITGLSKTYKNGVKAVDNINLKISSGMFGLLGPNGAGKSTLMRILATLQEPEEGEVMFDNIDILKEKNELRRLLGYLPQDFGLYPKVKAEDMLNHFAGLKGISDKNERKEIVKAVLTQCNLYEDRKKNLGEYSGGMKQRFGIAQLLLAHPKFIIVDEPTAGLDPVERNRFLNILREIGTNYIVIISTHIVDDVKELCTDMAIMNNGKILLKQKPSEAINSLNGKIWEKIIVKDELTKYQEAYRVLTTKYDESNELHIRIFSETAPDQSFNSIIPELEDVYFHTLMSVKN